MSNTIWFNDPIILIHKDNIYQIIPDSMMNNSEKINALSRLIILLTIVLFLISRKLTILISGFIALGLIYLIYDNKKLTENFENIDTNDTANISYENPLNNCLQGDEPKEKKEAPLAYTEENEKKINNAVMNMIQENNPSFKNINDKLFKDLGEKFEFNRSMIPFNSNPSTTIPNDQGSFADFCYGDMISGKEGNEFKLMGQSKQLHYNSL